jgi:hypothetical protein
MTAAGPTQTAFPSLLGGKRTSACQRLMSPWPIRLTTASAAVSALAAWPAIRHAKARLNPHLFIGRFCSYLRSVHRKEADCGRHVHAIALVGQIWRSLPACREPTCGRQSGLCRRPLSWATVRTDKSPGRLSAAIMTDETEFEPKDNCVSPDSTSSRNLPSRAAAYHAIADRNR